MGCWNATCALTQLPIYAGEPVLAFIVRKNPFEGDFCGGGYIYPEDSFVPISPAIVGVYDDYGSIDDILTDAYILDDLRRRFQSGELELKSKQHVSLLRQGPQPIESYSLKELIDFVERGAVVAKDVHGEHPVSLILVIKRIYDALETRQFVGEIQTMIEEELEESIALHMYMTGEKGVSALPFNHPHYSLCRYLDPLWNAYLENEDNELYNALITVNLLNQLFLMYRKSWAPQTGAGSQRGHEFYDDLLDEMRLHLEHCNEEGA